MCARARREVRTVCVRAGASQGGARRGGAQRAPPICACGSGVTEGAHRHRLYAQIACVLCVLVRARASTCKYDIRPSVRAFTPAGSC